MKSFYRITIALVFIGLMPQLSLACDMCGSYFGIMPMENRNAISIVHRYRVYNGYTSINQNGQMFPSGAYRLPQSPSVLHTSHATTDLMAPDDYESYKIIELRAKYFVINRVQLDLSVPLINNKTKALGTRANVWGIGDISFSAAYRVLQSDTGKAFRHRLMIGLGAKLPTGDNDRMYSDGDRLPLILQPGTGAVDAFAVITYSASYKDWLIGFTSHNRYPFENKRHERLAPVINNTLIIAKYVDKDSWKFYPQVQLYQEYTAGTTDHGYEISGTEMNNVLLGPGLDCYVNQFGFNACIQLPLYQNVFEMNMEMTMRAIVGISYNFVSTQ